MIRLGSKKYSFQKKLDLEEIRKEYVENNRTIKWLCEKYNYNYSTIKLRLDALGIKPRHNSVYLRGTNECLNLVRK